jgi:transcriptional regulator with XRE-family HTH domain
MDGTPRDTRAPKRRRRIKQNGAAIKSMRELAGYSQDGLAHAAGMTQAALSLIESERSAARPATLIKIARELRVPVVAIMRELEDAESARGSAA